MEVFFIIAGILLLLFLILKMSFVISNKRHEKKEAAFKKTIPKDKQRLLAFGAIYFEATGDYTRTLVSTGRTVKEITEGLRSWWQIYDHDSACKVILRLIDNDYAKDDQELYANFRNNITPTKCTDQEIKESLQHLSETKKELLKNKYYPIKSGQFECVKTISAWNFARAANNIKLSYAAGYITEDEAWHFLQILADKAEGEFSNWEEYFLSFIFGRAVSFRNSDYQYIATGLQLLGDKNKIWNDCPIRQ